MSADYLFQKDKHYDVCYDTGDKVSNFNLGAIHKRRRAIFPIL